MIHLATAVQVGVVLCFLLPFAFTASTVYPLLIGKSLYIRVMVEIVAAMWAVLIIYRPEYRPRLGSVTVALAALVFITILATIFSDNPNVSFWSVYIRSQGTFEFLHWMLLAVIAASVLNTPRLLNHIPVTCVLAGVAVCALSLYFAHVATPFDGYVIGRRGQLGSIFGQHTYLAAYLVFTACCALILLSRLTAWETLKTRLSALFLLASVGFYGYIVWLSSSRYGFIVLVLVLVLHLILTAVFSKNRVVKWTTLGSVVAVFAFMTVAAVVAFTLESSREHYQGRNPIVRIVATFTDSGGESFDRGSFNIRRQAFVASYKGFPERPLLGTGPDLYDRMWIKHVIGDPGKLAWSCRSGA